MNNEWNEAGTKPDHPCLCQTKAIQGKTHGSGVWFHDCTSRH